MKTNLSSRRRNEAHFLNHDCGATNRDTMTNVAAALQLRRRLEFANTFFPFRDIRPPAYHIQDGSGNTRHSGELHIFFREKLSGVSHKLHKNTIELVSNDKIVLDQVSGFKQRIFVLLEVLTQCFVCLSASKPPHPRHSVDNATATSGERYFVNLVPGFQVLGFVVIDRSRLGSQYKMRACRKYRDGKKRNDDALSHNFFIGSLAQNLSGIRLHASSFSRSQHSTINSQLNYA
jgi:hypothetical protein